jgi:hypothetical protein
MVAKLVAGNILWPENRHVVDARNCAKNAYDILSSSAGARQERTRSKSDQQMYLMLKMASSITFSNSRRTWAEGVLMGANPPIPWDSVTEPTQPLRNRLG